MAVRHSMGAHGLSTAFTDVGYKVFAVSAFMLLEVQRLGSPAATATLEGVVLAGKPINKTIITEETSPRGSDFEWTANDITEQGAVAVRCSELLGGLSQYDSRATG
jgi:hypothetical protein